MDLLEKINRSIGVIPKLIQKKADSSLGVGVFYISEIKKDKELYELVYAVRKLKTKTQIQKIMAVTESGKVRNCYYNWGGCNPGFKVYGFDGKGNNSYYYNFDYESRMDEAVSEFPQERCYRTVVNINDIPKLDPSLKYCSFSNYGLPFVNYIRIYRRWPKQAEMLMKFNLLRMLTEKNCERLSKDPYFHRWLERHHEECKCLSYQMAHNSWKRNPEADPKDYSKSFSYRIEISKKLSQDNKEIYEVLKQYASRERIFRYIEENKINVSSYMDYIKACQWLKLDFHDTKVLFPKDFQTYHDEYIRQYSEFHNKAKNERIKKTAKKFSYLEKSRYGFTVKVAQSKTELIAEGDALHHCVGRMDYDKRMEDGKSVICFIRKEDSPAVPYVTAEIKVGDTLRITQCYGLNNRQVPEVKDFTDWWIKNANRRFKRAV